MLDTLEHEVLIARGGHPPRRPVGDHELLFALVAGVAILVAALFV
ncbi:MAG: hypothetical protein R3F62_26410 [Planctomycetota bacterium]